MKLLHTGDWHLGDRLGSEDRTDDLRRAVERVVGLAINHEADVLVVAGDIFSERCRADHLRDAVAELTRVLKPYFEKGGTVVAITGNHDNETFCRTLQHAMALAAPDIQHGSLCPSGRFYLAAGPSFFRLRDRAGLEVQFVLMPYPTEPRYLKDHAQKYDSLEQKHHALQAAYSQALQSIRQQPPFNPALPSVLVAHIFVKGSSLRNLFRISEAEDIVFAESDIPTGWAYVALGHIHEAQCLMNLSHVRYCGSIERLDLGERDNPTSVTLAEIGPQGMIGEPALIRLDATPFLDVTIADPSTELAELEQQYSDAARALVHCQVYYRRSRDDLNAILRELHRIFPRCYHIEWHDSDITSHVASGETAPQSFRETVLGYLKEHLTDHGDRDALMKLAEQLLLEPSSSSSP